MAMDPPSTPHPDGHRPAPGPDGAAGIVVPDQDLLTRVLDEMQLTYVVDGDGDLAAPWENFRTYFMFSGDDAQRVLAVRTFYDRPYPIDEKLRLVDAADDWNRRTLWPKVYSHTHDDGTVRLIGETNLVVGAGVYLEHFVTSVVSWVRAAIEFDRWLLEQPGLTHQTSPGAGGNPDAGGIPGAGDPGGTAG